MRSYLFFLYSRYIANSELAKHVDATSIQDQFLLKTVSQARNTEYGRDYNFTEIESVDEFRNKVPLCFYEDLITYIEQVKVGKKKILTNQKIAYLLMTSGTSAGSKYIPITKKGIAHQIDAAKKLLCFYSVAKGNANFLNGKMLFLQGSPKLEHEYKIPTGRLSGIVYHHVPAFFQKNKLPSYAINIIENWQEKIRKIKVEIIGKDITVFGGIPPWCLQFWEMICKEQQIENLQRIYPNLSLYIYGGVDYTPYKAAIQKVLGESVDMMQTFPASEGFFGIQDRLDSDDMILLIDQGIYYEFIPIDFVDQSQPKTVTLSEVELQKKYELVITNGAGLWRYRMGDLVEFTSVLPYRIRVVGRTSQFISAFGEHVIGVEIETTIAEAINHFDLNIEDYHVSPNMKHKCYEWRIEWKNKPIELSEIESYLDQTLASKNKYYQHLITGSIIRPCRIVSLPNGSFQKLRSKNNKEGGQNKVIRLSNNDNFSKQFES